MINLNKIKEITKLNFVLNGCLVGIIIFLLAIIYLFIGKRAIGESIDFATSYMKYKVSNQLILELPVEDSNLNFQGVWPIKLKLDNFATTNSNIEAVFVRVYEDGEEVFAERYQLSTNKKFANEYITYVPRKIINERLSTGEFVVDYGYIYRFFNNKAPWVVMGKVNFTSDYSSEQNGSIVKIFGSVPSTINSNGGVVYSDPVDAILKHNNIPVYEFRISKADEVFEYKFGTKVDPKEITLEVPGSYNYRIDKVQIDDKTIEAEDVFVRFLNSNLGSCKTNFPKSEFLSCRGEYYFGYNEANPLSVTNIAIDVQGRKFGFNLYGNGKLLHEHYVNKPGTIFYDYYGEIHPNAIKIGLSEYANPRSEIMQIVIDGEVYETENKPEWRYNDYAVFNLIPSDRKPVSSPF